MSMIKSNLGEALSSVAHHARNRQMRLLVVAHDIMVVLLIPRFATERICHFLVSTK